MQLNWGPFILSIGFILVYIVSPIGSLILSFIKIYTNSKKLQYFGKAVCECDSVNIASAGRKEKVIFSFMIILIILFLFVEPFIGIISLIIMMQIATEMYLQKKYKRLNGFYSNGVILGTEIISWDKIHSYKKLDNKISILKMNGNRVDTDNIMNMDLCLTLLADKDIKEEQNY